MKTKIILFCLFLSFNLSFKAQNYVTIPDANFVAWLQSNYPSCMNGNQMNIDCAEIQSETFVNVNNLNISNLSGIEYFNNLSQLFCEQNLLTSLPMLSNTVTNLFCSLNQITNLPTLPSSLITLYCYYNELAILPNLPSSLQKLACGNNQLTNLPTLTSNLQELICYNNQLTNLPNLPNSLLTLDCNYNQLTNLPNLPISLEKLDCAANNLSILPILPNSLLSLNCNGNQISHLEPLPLNLNHLHCGGNLLTQLPELPASLISLGCGGSNQLSNLPNLPMQLEELYCNNSQILDLPILPITLKFLWCHGNLLTSLPSLPVNLTTLYCGSNNISCFPIFPNSLLDSNYFNISNNPFSCLPNYIPAMGNLYLSFPFCIENDFINNISGCNSSIGSNGSIFLDENSNCFFDNSENTLSNVSIKLYSSQDSLLRQTYTLSSGMYYFPLEAGIYSVRIDTVNTHYSFNCQNLDTIITLDAQNPLVDSVNFALTCKPGFDIGVQSVTTNGIVFPGQTHGLKILAGDISQWYNMACASGISGEVQISVSGPLTYLNPISDALIPTISGNTFTYTISDFGNIDISSAFGLIFTIDSTAQGGDEICVLVNVTPTNGDNSMTNNTFDYCYHVVNSYDPNMKEVYPVNVPPAFEDYFTYTIHFQNTGSAPAFNIRLLDTVDANLDLETFQVTNYSHFNKVNVIGNQLNVYFPNIMLQDSTTDLEGSKGFVQYRIKPKVNLALGTQIKNTANIYFDFNAPIVTNTTVNEYVQTNSIAENESKLMNIFPNPFSSSTTVVFKSSLKNADLTLYNVYGQKVRTISDFSGDKLKINRENLASGVYYLSLESENNSVETVKLVVGD